MDLTPRTRECRAGVGVYPLYGKPQEQTSRGRDRGPEVSLPLPLAAIAPRGIQQIAALSIATLSIATLSIATLSIAALSIATLSIATLSIATLSIAALSIASFQTASHRLHLLV